MRHRNKQYAELHVRRKIEQLFTVCTEKECMVVDGDYCLEEFPTESEEYMIFVIEFLLRPEREFSQITSFYRRLKKIAEEFFRPYYILVHGFRIWIYTLRPLRFKEDEHFTRITYTVPYYVIMKLEKTYERYKKLTEKRKEV